MNLLRRARAFVPAMVLAAVTAAASPIASGRESRAMWLNGGWDLTWDAGLGLAVPVTVEGQLAEVRVSLDVPVVLVPRLGGGRLSVALEQYLGPARGLFMSTTALVTGSFAHDALGTRLGWGLGLTARPGWSFEWLRLYATLGTRLGVGSYAWHSEEVRALFPDPERAPAGAGAWLPSWRVRAGAGADVQVTKPLRLFVDGGLDWTFNRVAVFANPPVMPLPFYAEAGASWAF